MAFPLFSGLNQDLSGETFLAFTCSIASSTFTNSLKFAFVTDILNVNKSVSTILVKIYETNFIVSVKQHTTGKVKFQFLISFLLVLTKFSFWEEDWALGYNSMTICDIFLIFPNFLRSEVLSRSATCEPTHIYHVYY